MRLMTGAHGDLSQMVRDGKFRSDLFYALATAELAILPLRHRLEDLPLLAQHCLFDLGAAHGKPVNGLSELAIEFLSNYDWPGNLPELTNELTRMLMAAQDVLLGPELISRHILQADPSLPSQNAREDADALCREGTLKERVEGMEIRILRETLTRLKWNKSRAAAELGLSRVGLRAKLDRYGIQQPGPVTADQEED